MKKELRILLAAAALAAPLAAQTPFGTAFTYQGRMSDMGGPANGTYDIRFTLFDAFTMGISKGTLTLNGVAVSGGLFTVDLDFGAGAFDGSARWMELAVQKMGGGFTTLLPRQELTSTPYATTIFARTVVVKPLGTPAQNGTQLVAVVNGITTASISNRWTVKLEPGIYDVGAPGTLVMKPFVDLEGSGENVTKITGTGSGANTQGTIGLVTNSELRFVTVENTGGGLTYAKAILVDTASPSLRHVTARASGATLENQGVFVTNAGSNPVLDDVTASVTSTGGANGFGVLVLFGAVGRLRKVDASATGGGSATGYLVYGSGSAPDIIDVRGSAAGTSYAYAITVSTGASTTIQDSSFDASGSPTSFGVNVNGGSSVTLRNVRATANATASVLPAPTGGAGIYAQDSSLSTENVHAIGNAPSGTFSYGLNTTQTSMNLVQSVFEALGPLGDGVVATNGSGGPYGINLDRCTMQGASFSVSAGVAAYNLRVGGSHFVGATSVSGPATMTCASSWNAAYTFFASSCPP